MELLLLILSLAAWAIALAGFGGLLDLAGALDLGLQQFFALAAAVGWLTGNLYVYRSRGAAAAVRRGMLVAYLLGPPGILYLVRALAPLTRQAEAPLAPVFAGAIFLVFFFVPVSFRRGGGENSRRASQ